MKLKIKFLHYFPEILSINIVFILIIAFILQYIFGFLPCKLCQIQRVPYFFICFFALLYFCSGRKHKSLFVILSFLALLAVAIISFYHAGIEYGFFSNIFNCQATENFNDINKLRSYLDNRIAVSCNEPAFKFILSLSGWNFMISFSFIICSIIFIKYKGIYDK